MTDRERIQLLENCLVDTLDALIDESEDLNGNWGRDWLGKRLRDIRLKLVRAALQTADG